MCITTLTAELHSTLIGVWDINHPQHGYRHVLAYQNVPINQSNSANCMLLHIPSAEALTPDDILNTEDSPNFLRETINKILVKKQEEEFDGMTRGLREQPQNYITQMGVYHIAILNNVKDAQQTLNQIPSEKRPVIEQKFFDFFEEKFPNFPLLLCCFNNQDALEASPIMVHFSPIRKDVFQANMLESHGDLPELGSPYNAHQILLYGSQKKEAAKGDVREIDWTAAPEDLQEYLPKYGQVEDFRRMPIDNYDLLIDANAIGKGNKGVEVEFGLLSNFKSFDEIEEEDLTFDRMNEVKEEAEVKLSWWKKIKKRFS
jgi:hypothetical protein